MIKAGLWLYMELRTLTHLLQARALPPYHFYREYAPASSNWVRVHNSTYNHRTALIMTTQPLFNKADFFVQDC